ncbi:MAG: enoyl-CoA hydratase/isomerase family protein, partial [Afipia sp.]|nr:enoyl-CoA hydratase/isomerase family protein [Afipia sp.]
MDFVVTESYENVLLIRLNRPRQRNALNRQSLIELGAVIDSALNDDAIRAVVLTGSDQAFSAGQDLKEPEAPDYIELINATFDRLEKLPKPT